MFLPSGDVYVFDVDGVLIDPGERLRKALRMAGLSEDDRPKDIDPNRRQLFWKYFLSEDLLNLDKPRDVGIRLLLDRLGKGVVVVLTGRPYRLYKATLDELKRAGIPVDRVILIMRPNNDRRSDLEFKSGVFARIPRLVEVHDDEEKILLEAKRIHPEARVILHYNDNYAEK